MHSTFRIITLTIFCLLLNSCFLAKQNYESFTIIAIKNTSSNAIKNVRIEAVYRGYFSESSPSNIESIYNDVDANTQTQYKMVFTSTYHGDMLQNHDLPAFSMKLKYNIGNTEKVIVFYDGFPVMDGGNPVFKAYKKYIIVIDNTAYKIEDANIDKSNTWINLTP